QGERRRLHRGARWQGPRATQGADLTGAHFRSLQLAELQARLQRHDGRCGTREDRREKRGDQIKSPGQGPGSAERVVRPLGVTGFAQRLIRWQRHHGRHDLPWQNTGDAYAIWVSEIMLQQTQVAAVIPYYRRFMQRFPDVVRLARAPLDDVLAAW